MATHPFDWATWGRIDATELAAKLETKDATIAEVMRQFADAVSSAKQGTTRNAQANSNRPITTHPMT